MAGGERWGRRRSSRWGLSLGVLALAGSALLNGGGLGRGEGAEDEATPDLPTPLVDGVWTVDSRLPGLVGRVFPARMTVFRLPDGGLLLHSPTRCTPALKEALEREGPIRHLAAPNVAHWIFLKDWQRACPDAVTWGAPNLGKRRQVRRSGVRLDRILFEGTPIDWGGAIDLVTVPGALGFREVAFMHKPTATLVLTDLMMDLAPGSLPLPLRPLVLAAGMTAPDRMPPPHLRFVVRAGGEDARHAGARVAALSPERVVFAHGRVVTEHAPAALRRSLRWLLG